MPSAASPNKRFGLKLAVFAVLAAVTCVFYIDLCGLYFQCGCRSLWAGAASQCNIHQPHLKHCPLCLLPTYEYLALVATVLIAQSWLIRRESWLWAVFSFPLLTAAQAFALGWYRGYWS